MFVDRQARHIMVISEMIFPGNLLTDAKHPAVSTNHLADIDKTKHDYSQEQHENLKTTMQTNY